MRTSAVRARALSVAVAAAFAAGCAVIVKTPPPTELPEVRPGYVAGYLEPGELPDSVALVPPPPAAGSAALAADEEGWRASRALRGSARWDQAARDAELRFPAAAAFFSCALDMPISAEATPHLNMLLRRVRMDASRANDKAKDHYKRPRPYMVAKEPSCTPKEEARQKPDAYPSGHASIGWAWALVLAEAAPGRADAILARGLAYGESRVVCGVHWKSDLDAGRLVGAATVSRLHASGTFRDQVEYARREIEAARAAGARSPEDCAGLAKALSARP